MKSGLVILDRDGVINFDSDDYIKTPAEWIPIPGSLEAVARLTRADYTVVVATNQSGIARGLYDMATLNQIHHKMTGALRDHGGQIDAVFFCPHGPNDNCHCRKPKPGLLEQISSRLNVSLNGVPVVGDSLRDLECAQAVGALPALVRTGNGKRTEDQLPEALKGVAVFDDLAAFTEALLLGGLEPLIAPVSSDS